MELTTIIGLVTGVVCVVVGIMLQGIFSDYIDIPSLFIVLGGTLAATILNYPLSSLKKLGKVISITFKKVDFDLHKTIKDIIDLANLARKEGLFALDNKANEIEEPFFKKGLLLVVDGTDPELIRNILETDLTLMEDRHKECSAMLFSMSAYAPAFGMIGTLIGLIGMLKNLNDASTLGAGMSTALITTLYGCILANLLCTPMAGKLNAYTEKETQYKELVIEGLLSIQAGENPRLIEEKLLSFMIKNDNVKDSKGGSSDKESESNAKG